jgi:hypothetical protein
MMKSNSVNKVDTIIEVNTMFLAEQLCSNVVKRAYVQCVGEHRIERGVLAPHRHVHVCHGLEGDGEGREGL